MPASKIFNIPNTMNTTLNNMASNDIDTNTDTQQAFRAIIKMTVNEIVTLSKLYLQNYSEINEQSVSTSLTSPTLPSNTATTDDVDKATTDDVAKVNGADDNKATTVDVDEVTTVDVDEVNGADDNKVKSMDINRMVNDNIKKARIVEYEKKELELKDEIFKKLHTFMNKLHEHQSMLYLSYVSGLDLTNMFKKDQHSRSSSPVISKVTNTQTLIPTAHQYTDMERGEGGDSDSGDSSASEGNVDMINGIDGNILNIDDINVPGSRTPVTQNRRPYQFDAARSRYAELRANEIHRRNKLQEARDHVMAMQLNREESTNHMSSMKPRMPDESWAEWRRRNNYLYENTVRQNTAPDTYDNASTSGYGHGFRVNDGYNSDISRKIEMNWHEERQNRWNDSNGFNIWDKDKSYIDNQILNHTNVIEHEGRSRDMANVNHNKTRRLDRNIGIENSNVWESDSDYEMITGNILMSLSSSSSSSICGDRHTPVDSLVENIDTYPPKHEELNIPILESLEIDLESKNIPHIV